MRFLPGRAGQIAPGWWHRGRHVAAQRVSARARPYDVLGHASQDDVGKPRPAPRAQHEQVGARARLQQARGGAAGHDLRGRLDVAGAPERPASRLRQGRLAFLDPAVEGGRFDWRLAGNPPRGRLARDDRDDIQVGSGRSASPMADASASREPAPSSKPTTMRRISARPHGGRGPRGPPRSSNAAPAARGPHSAHATLGRDVTGADDDHARPLLVGQLAEPVSRGQGRDDDGPCPGSELVTNGADRGSARRRSSM